MAVNYDLPSDGITKETPANMMFGAGTIHENLAYNKATGKWNFKESLLFATTGGSSLKFEWEITDMEVDGAWTKVEDLQVKTNETVTLELNIAELSERALTLGLLGEKGPGKHKDSGNDETDIGFDEVRGTEVIQPGHYMHNFAFVGQKINGEPIIVMFDRAICTSGLEMSSGNKEQVSPKMTVECVGKLDESHKKLPWHIYYPTPNWAVRYNLNGGTGTLPEEQRKIKDTALTLAATTGISKTGYTINGWNTEPGGDGDHYDSAGSYTENAEVLLYAEWQAESNDNADNADKDDDKAKPNARK